MERETCKSSRDCQEIERSVSIRTKWLTIQSLKKVPEDLENLCKILKVVKRKDTYHAGSKHRTVSSLKKRSRTIFTQFRTISLVEVEVSVRIGMKDDIIHDAEQLRRYISPERWIAWILRMR